MRLLIADEWRPSVLLVRTLAQLWDTRRPVLLDQQPSASRRVWVFDYAGLNGNSRYRPRSCCLPRITKTSASGLHLFEARPPTPAYTPAYASLSPPRYQRKTRGRVDRYAFLVRILHSLLHAGLARRTAIATLQQLGPAGLPKPFICRELLVQFRFCRKVPGQGASNYLFPRNSCAGSTLLAA
jgi:hypothetical protein